MRIYFNMKNKCEICGFDKRIEKHHIIKFNDFGSDEIDNIIYLCPNHHWIADFGNEEDKSILLKQIKSLTKKEGKMNYQKKKYYDHLIRILMEEDLRHESKNFTEEEWDGYKKNSFNYDFYKKIFLSRQSSIHYCYKNSLIEKAEILYLKKLLSQKLLKTETLDKQFSL